MKVAAIRTSTSGSLHVTLRSAADRMRRISLAAHYGRAFTRWTAGFHTPTLARSLGVSHTRTGKIVPNVAVESPLSLGGRDTLGNATRCRRNTRAASGLCQLWGKKGGNCANNHSSNQELIHDALLTSRDRALASGLQLGWRVLDLRISLAGLVDKIEYDRSSPEPFSAILKRPSAIGLRKLFHERLNKWIRHFALVTSL